ncbi:MAG: hypothetical protein ACI92C_001924, partial [Neolewinella sp.]
RIYTLIITSCLFISCQMNQEFVDQSMAKFDDQACKDVVALVELYNLRNGSDPVTIENMA